MNSPAVNSAAVNRMLDALADCRAAQRRHGDAVVQGEAEAGRLTMLGEEPTRLDLIGALFLGTACR